MAKKCEFAKIIDGITVQYDTCTHCGDTPTLEEIKAAIKMEIGGRAYTCAVCGIGNEIISMLIYHYKDAEQDRWGSRGTYNKPMITLEMSGAGHVRVPVHPDCAKAALPKFKWPDLTNYI